TLTYIEETKNSYEAMPLFLKFKATWEDDLTNMQLILKVNPDFEYILNNWNEGKWTKFMLNEFIQIESTYSKTLFRLLKQWKTVGKREFTLDEFKKLMDIPKSYNVGRINDRIVKNGIRDLEQHFKDLRVKIVKANTKGNPVIGYKFTRNPEETSSWEQDKFNKVPSKKQTYKTGKKKRYRSKNGSIEAKEFAERAREERFKRMLELRKEEEGENEI
ncbi:MAG: replication initiation protein, partial [Gemella haemolysans]